MSVCSRQLATDGDGQNRCGSAFGGTFRDSDRPECAHESEKPPGGLIGFIDIEPPVTVLYADVCVLRFVPDGANPQVFSCQTGVRLSGDVTVIFFILRNLNGGREDFPEVENRSCDDTDAARCGWQSGRQRCNRSVDSQVRSCPPAFGLHWLGRGWISCVAALQAGVAIFPVVLSSCQLTGTILLPVSPPAKTVQGPPAHR